MRGVSVQSSASDSHLDAVTPISDSPLHSASPAGDPNLIPKM